MRTKKNSPRIGKSVYIHPSAVLIGEVRIREHSSIWPGCVLRGDINRIEIGRATNIQDLCILHVETGLACRIGNYVTVGHRATLHACTVADGALIGMGSIVLDGAVVGKACLLGAGSLVPPGKNLKPGSLYLGRPAKFIRKLTRRETGGLKRQALRYVRYARDHARGKYIRARPAGL